MNPPDWASCTEDELWRYVATHLTESGIECVLVGGAVVAIYSGGIYRSGDLDLVLPDGVGDRGITDAMTRIAFVRRGRHFVHPECAHLFVEFVRPPVAIGDDYNITPLAVQVARTSLKILSPTDCVKDRLASFIHFKARECLDQAVLVARSQPIDRKEVARWCGREGPGGREAFKDFERLLDASS